MKKTLFAALALVAMASCSNEEVIEMAQKEAIAFNNAFVNNSTRSVNDPSFTNNKLFSEFKVYGYVNTFSLWTNGEVVTGTALNGTWSYTNTQYWINGANYAFHAVAPATGWTATANESTGLTLSFSNSDGKSDVLYATADAVGQASDNEQVNLTFNHILSKVKFSFKNAYNGSNASIRVRNIKITNAYSTGSVALPAKTWTTDNTKATLVLNFGNAATTAVDAEEPLAYNATVESYNELLLIPNAVTGGYNVTFDVDLLVSDKVIETYQHTAKADFTPVAGFSYDINAEISAKNIDPENPNGQEPIEFTVTEINDWTKGADVTLQ